jgi:hypothetical protein
MHYLSLHETKTLVGSEPYVLSINLEAYETIFACSTKLRRFCCSLNLLVTRAGPSPGPSGLEPWLGPGWALSC